VREARGQGRRTVHGNAVQRFSKGETGVEQGCDERKEQSGHGRFLLEACDSRWPNLSIPAALSNVAAEINKMAKA
jgi:hypothetical protein